VRQQVAHRHLLARNWIAEPKVGDVGRDGGVEIHLAIVDQHLEPGGGECLRVRPDGEDRPLVDELGAPELTYANPLA
jgi:hypothetical protein